MPVLLCDPERRRGSRALRAARSPIPASVEHTGNKLTNAAPILGGTSPPPFSQGPLFAQACRDDRNRGLRCRGSYVLQMRDTNKSVRSEELSAMRLNRHHMVRVLGSAVIVVILATSGSFADDSSPNATGSGFEYPSGSAARIAKAFVHAFNSGDETTLANFCTTHESDAALEASGDKKKMKNGPFSRKLKEGTFAVSVEMLPARGTAPSVLEKKRSEICIQFDNVAQ